jgi:integrase
VITPEAKMAKTGLPLYVMPDKQRDGSPRWLFRRKGFPKVTLPGPPHSKEFWAAYAAALNGRPLAPKKQESALRTKQPKSHRKTKVEAGTLGWLCQRYFASGEFLQCDLITQKGKKWVLNAALREPLVKGKPLTFETCPLTSLTRAHIVTLRDRKVETPTAANARLAKLKQLFEWAIDEEIMTSNPAEKVKPLDKKKGGHHTWTLAEVKRFEETHPVGTKARLALEIMLYTGMRISDASQLGKQHATVDQDGVRIFSKPEWKFRTRKAKWINVPILPNLQKVLDESPVGDLTYLVSARGVPYSNQRLGNAFKEWCVEAGLPHCSAHGLRKAGATRAAENGAKVHQLMSIYGWADAKEAIVYTQEVERKRMAKEAMHLLLPKEKA